MEEAHEDLVSSYGTTATDRVDSLFGQARACLRRTNDSAEASIRPKDKLEEAHEDLVSSYGTPATDRVDAMKKAHDKSWAMHFYL